MMKLEVEIKDGRFIYSYDIGSSKFNSDSEVNSESLCGFTELLNHCRRITEHRDDDFWKRMKARSWIESNLEEAKKFIMGQGAPITEDKNE